MDCAIYARVSTRDKQDAANQLYQLRDFAKTQGWKIIKEYTDEDSGRKSARPQFQAMLADASRHRFSVILFWSLDRFSREGALETLGYLRRLTGYGIHFRSFTQQYIDSCGYFRDAIISILAVIAAQETQVISERTIAGLERARRAGKTLGRPPIAYDAAKLAEALLRRGRRRCTLRWIAREFRVSKNTAAKMRAAVEAHQGNGSIPPRQ